MYLKRTIGIMAPIGDDGCCMRQRLDVDGDDGSAGAGDGHDSSRYRHDSSRNRHDNSRAGHGNNRRDRQRVGRVRRGSVGG